MKKQSPLRNRVKELRARLGIRQADLAREVSITRQTIIAIEKGRLNPSILICLKISRLLREPVDYVFYLAPGWDGESGVLEEDEPQPAANTRVRVAAKPKRKAAASQGDEVAFEADRIEPRVQDSAVPDRVALDRDADATEEPEEDTAPAETEVVPEPARAATPAASDESSDEPADDKEKQGQAIWDFF